MKLVYLYSESKRALKVPANKGIERVPYLLRRLVEKGIIVEWINVDELSEDEVEKYYLDAIKAAVYRKYRIRRIFGTKRHSGVFFGRGVPALLVYEGDEVVDVYPHENIFRIKTIFNFLNDILKVKDYEDMA